MRAFGLLFLMVGLFGCASEPTPVGEVKGAIAFQASCNVEPGQYAVWGPTCYYAAAKCDRWSWRYFWRNDAGRVIARNYVDGIGWDDLCWDVSPFDRSRSADVGDPYNFGNGYSAVNVSTDFGRYRWITMDGGDTWMQMQ
ncbi:MAG TPA: hypothetical protein VFI56_09205 [Vicinamibacterales bacterium]|nr:hypothetical protein [Vicinamibacterales bacterium]